MSELDQYAYDLPERLIAQHPAPQRIDARLMVVDRARGEIAHAHVRDLPNLLGRGDCLVLNDTKVCPAQLQGVRDATGGRWQGLFLQAEGSGWRILCKTRGKLFVGEKLTLWNRNGVPDGRLHLQAKLDGGAWAATIEPGEDLDPNDAFAVLERVGRTPLPHYIRGGHGGDEDETRYQTVYARSPGSAAAPTAGLHFTMKLLQECMAAGAEVAATTLHVGLDTFRPVKAERLADHVMHREWRRVEQAAVDKIKAAKAAGGRVVAVGTTTVRTLESSVENGALTAGVGETDLFIRPPFQFQVVDALLTNFHLPRSTLLVLVRTFGGEELMQRAYAEAVEQEYRFFSYGDAMLIL